MNIPFNKPFLVGKELYYMAQAVMRGRLSGNGPYTKKCHSWFEDKLGTEKALLTHSCTAALEMAAILCDIGPGDEVIMPSYTFVSTANAFVLRGAIPVFVDIRKDTLNMDEHCILEAISPKTKAIVPVHYAGNPCEMLRIMEIAKEYNLFVIEDAAQALLSTYRDDYLGTIGDLGCLSFHETKNVISGEGGALLINNSDLKERAEIIWEKGTNRSKFFRGEVDKYTWVDVGSSFLPSELTAGFLFAQLEEAERIIAKRVAIINTYTCAFSELEERGLVRLPHLSPHSVANGHMFYMILDSLRTREALIARLKEKDILSVFHYVPLHNSPAGKRFCRSVGNMENTLGLSSRLLRLPVFYDLKPSEQQRVVDEVKGFFEEI